jgi:hypothetical protein
MSSPRATRFLAVSSITASPRCASTSEATSADSPFCGLGEIAGRSVQVDAELARGLRVEHLAQPSGDHAGEHVAHAAARHPGVAGGIDEHGLLGRRDDRAMALQHT